MTEETKLVGPGCTKCGSTGLHACTGQPPPWTDEEAARQVAAVNALSWSAFSRFAREFETNRRRAAVELVLSLGYRWEDDEWKLPAPKDES